MRMVTSLLLLVSKLAAVSSCSVPPAMFPPEWGRVRGSSGSTGAAGVVVSEMARAALALQASRAGAPLMTAWTGAGVLGRTRKMLLDGIVTRACS